MRVVLVPGKLPTPTHFNAPSLTMHRVFPLVDTSVILVIAVPPSVAVTVDVNEEVMDSFPS